MARLLAKKGYGLILVARNKSALDRLAKELETEAIVIPMDLSKRKNCIKLFYMLKDKPIDVLINNAGFGCFGEFYKTDLMTELDMINVNVTAVHILTKLFLKKMRREKRGYIMNVASLASYASGPLMSTYYATKSYVLKLTGAVYRELKHSKSPVSISAFCPGPVDTDFNNRAGVSFGMRPIDSKFAAYRAIKGMFEKKSVIFPRRRDALTAFAAKHAPEAVLSRVCMHIQNKKL
jgi:hypothetical protein